MGLFSDDSVGFLKWESIRSYGKLNLTCYRSKVHGGWLVMSIANHTQNDGNMTFVPDPNHEWKLDQTKS